MLPLLVILIEIAILLLIAIPLFFAEMGWGFFRPENNIEYPILRGKTLDCTMRDSFSYRLKKDSNGKMALTPKETSSLLWKLFGIRYFGFPGFYKLGKVIVNYPASLRGSSGELHKTQDTVPGFTVHRNYLVVVNVDFQGGISFEMQLNLEVLLMLAYVAWGRNGKFLDPLGQYIEGVINEWAMTINATDFIGKTGKSDLTDDEKNTIKNKVDSLRSEMCAVIMNLNGDTEGSTLKIKELCGYRIESIKYKIMKPSDEESAARLKQLERQNEAITETVIAEQEAKTQVAVAKGFADKTRIEGEATAFSKKVIGLARVEVWKAQKKVGGQEALIEEIRAKAITDTGLTVLATSGGGGSGIPPVLLSIPGVDKKSAKVEPKLESKSRTPEKK